MLLPSCKRGPVSYRKWASPENGCRDIQSPTCSLGRMEGGRRGLRAQCAARGHGACLSPAGRDFCVSSARPRPGWEQACLGCVHAVKRKLLEVPSDRKQKRHPRPPRHAPATPPLALVQPGAPEPTRRSASDPSHWLAEQGSERNGGHCPSSLWVPGLLHA